MNSVLGRHSRQNTASHRRRGAAMLFGPSDLLIAASAVGGVVVLALLSLREFAFSDYEVETLPAVQELLAGHLGAFVSKLPGYAGAVVLNAPFAYLGGNVGGDVDLWSWRAQAVPGLALLALLGIVAGRTVKATNPGRGGVAMGAVTALLVGGAPLAMRALETGHPEELLVAGLAVSAVLLALRERLVWAAVLVGFAAAAKPWALIAVPVVLAAAPDRRSFMRSAVVCGVAGAVLLAPSLADGGAERVRAQTHASTSGIFKPYNLFWYAGSTNPRWVDGPTAASNQLFQTDATKARWAQRLEPAWAAKVSHPSIIVFAFVLAVVFRWRRGNGRSAREDLLLVLAAACWWRCLLDTWNVHYYALAGLVALAVWEARRGRLPSVAIAATAATWLTFEIITLDDLTPDQHTLFYLTWALPLGIGLVWRAVAPESFRRTTAIVTGPFARRLPNLARMLQGASRG